jgi:outer membrane protein assembly factor BamE (lipoprotein component of BamABCDE complex)
MSRKPICLAFVFALACATALGCATHPAEDDADQLTVGKVQGEIKVGMAASSVAQILGSPNIVTTDEERREVWIYDKVSSSRVSSHSGIGGSIIIFGGSSSKDSSASTQKTLTVIIKFDENKLVRDFAYNYSQF